MPKTADKQWIQAGGDTVSEMTFREMMERLEEITSILEKEDLELEEGLRLFEEGVGLIREARQRLSQASSKVEKLIGSMEEGLSTEPFELEGDSSQND
jgi:exodeoxyribonuclease VII small subunit